MMLSQPSRFYDTTQLEIDRRNIVSKYQHKGFYFAHVDIQPERFSDDSSEVTLMISIVEGRQSVIGQIHLQGNAAIETSRILDGLSTRVGETLDPQMLEQDLQTLIGQYERIGYPFAKVEVADISLQEDSSQQLLRIQLNIDEGGRVTINEVRVQGNKETRDNVIIREARIAFAELYNEDHVAKISQRLRRLNIFSSVQEPELYVNAQGGGLLLTVEEGNTNTFDGVIGYVPGSSSIENGFVTGMVNVMLRNLFGTARKLDVRWQRDDRHSQDIGIAYLEPWVFDIPVNVSGIFFQRQQDTIYVRRIVGVKTDVMFSDVLSLGGSLNQENIIPSSTIAAQTVSNSRTMTAGLDVHYDSRDDIVSPTSGVNYRTDYQIGSKKIFGTPVGATYAQSTVQKIGLDAEAYVEPFERQVVAFGVHGRQITSDNIEVSDRYRFGGTNTLRGYRENQFLGSRIAWTNTEYRFLLARRSFFFGFFDTGYYFLPADDQHNISSTQNFTYGYGIGMRVSTTLGNIGVSIALGEGDTFGQAKLHFGLMSEF